MEHQNQTSEVKRALQEKVLLDDGRVGFVFSELVQIGPSNRWHCHVCSRTVDSERALVMHLSHPLHTVKLRLYKHPAKNFKKFADDDENGDHGPSRKDRLSPNSDGLQSSWEMTTDVLPGEPVPPGMEDVVEGVCQIQSTFDEHPGPLIGLEYIVELVTSEEESEPRYICLLCEKKGDPRSLMVHLTSQNHRLKLISCFFRTAGNALNMIPRTAENRKGLGIAIMKVAQEIERNYGRLKPTSAVAETFAIKKYEILRQIDEKEHFRETPSTTFASLVTLEKIKEYSLQDDDHEVIHVSPEKNKDIDNKTVPVPRLVNPNFKSDKPLFKPISNDKGLKDIKKDRPVFTASNESDPIEVTSSISSVSSSLCSDDDKKGSSRRSSSRDRYSRKRRLSPDIIERRRHLYGSTRRGLSPPCSSRNSRGSARSRSRSRERDHHRRLPSAYYRERDRSGRSPSYGRSGRSPSYGRSGARSPSYNRGRSPSYRTGRSRYPDVRLRQKSPDRYDRERDRERRRRIGSCEKENSRERSSEKRNKSPERKKEIESKWDKYRAELHQLELNIETKLKYYEEKPEKHPKYSEEWKAFWNKRYKEIQLAGRDPSTYDFKPEWIVFWAKRMKELSEEDFSKERDALKKKMNIEDKPEKPPSSDLQDISPPTPESQKDVTVDDIKNTWKALTGSEITAPPSNQTKSYKRSPSPWENTTATTTTTSSSTYVPPVSHATDSERSSISTRKPYDIAPPVLHCLRMLSVLEHQLGSLGPKVMELLSKALVLERAKYNSSMTLLKDVDIHIFFETVKEKIRGQLIAGIVMRNLVSSSRAIIKAIETMLDTNPPVTEKLSPSPMRVPPVIPSYSTEPVQVPGIGMIDKMAVAQQIAGALVAQGKTDVTQEELEDLINAVVGIAKASNASVGKNVSSDVFFSQLNIENSTAASHINEILSNMISSAQKSLGIEVKKPVTAPQPVQPIVHEKKPPQINAILNTIQSTITPTEIKPVVTADATKDTTVISAKVVQSGLSTGSATSKDVSDEELKEKLMKFSLLSREEQQDLISLLKQLETTQSERVENLRKYVSIGLVPLSDKTNHSREESKDGRLSPFSSRTGGANPAPDDSQKGKQKGQSSPVKKDVNDDDDDDDDDDDYSVEDVYKAASEKLFKKHENTKLSSGLIKKNSQESDNKGSSGKDFAIPSIGTTLPDLSSANKAGQILPITTSSTNTLTSAQEKNVRSLAKSFDDIFGGKDPFQITLGTPLTPQNEMSNNFTGSTFKSYQGVKDDSYQQNTSQYDMRNYFSESGDKSQDFRGNNYNEYNAPPEAGNYNYNNTQVCPSYDSVPTNQNWQYGNSSEFNRGPDNFNNTGSKPVMNYQQSGGRNPTQQGYFRRPQNNEPQQPYGGGYRQF